MSRNPKQGPDTINLIVRKAIHEDARELSRIAGAAFELACPPDSDKSEITKYIAENFDIASFEQLLADGGVLVAGVWSETVAIGFLVLRLSSQCPVAGAPAPTAELQRLYLLPEWHGTGASQLLVSRALEYSSSNRQAGVWLSVFSENQRAIRFYEKSGFSKVGDLDFAMGNEVHLDHVMLASLDS